MAILRDLAALAVTFAFIAAAAFWLGVLAGSI
jgi:hypothetical protein